MGLGSTPAFYIVFNRIQISRCCAKAFKSHWLGDSGLAVNRDSSYRRSHWLGRFRYKAVYFDVPVDGCLLVQVSYMPMGWYNWYFGPASCAHLSLLVVIFANRLCATPWRGPAPRTSETYKGPSQKDVYLLKGTFIGADWVFSLFGICSPLLALVFLLGLVAAGAEPLWVKARFHWGRCA